MCLCLLKTEGSCHVWSRRVVVFVITEFTAVSKFVHTELVWDYLNFMMVHCYVQNKLHIIFSQLFEFELSNCDQCPSQKKKKKIVISVTFTIVWVLGLKSCKNEAVFFTILNLIIKIHYYRAVS